MQTKAKSEVNGFVYFAVGVAALGGLLFGYDTGVISGAILFIKKQFSLSATMEEIVVSSVLVGAVVGAAIGGALTDRFGRRKMIILAGIIFTVSAIGTALAPTVSWLIAARMVSGIAIGIASFISPMYIAELVPAKVRGSLVAVNMLAITTRHRGCLPGGLCVFRHRRDGDICLAWRQYHPSPWSLECGGYPTARAG